MNHEESLFRTVKVYQHGLTLGTRPMTGSHKRSPRGEVQGWSKNASRRNTNFLRGVLVDELDLENHSAFALTLTVKHCPPDSDEWGRLRTAFFHRLRRLGMHRLHWVTEWQRRAVPHLHAAVWLPSDISHREIIKAWLDLTVDLGSKPQGQYVLPITDSLGWFKYTAKHTARGAAHYQRSPASIPSGWKKTGRVWGKLGDWPERPPIVHQMDDQTFYRLRRFCRSWRVSDARREALKALQKKLAGDVVLGAIYSNADAVKQTLMFRIICRKELRRVKSARKMLQFRERNLCDVRGVSEWIPHKVSTEFMAYLYDQGGQIEC